MPTPLGNLRDITLRALDVLRECDLLVAEDTRVALRLLNALGLGSKPIWSYREQNAATATAGILARAAAGSVAVVSDAGMPGISDPGRELVAAARAAGIAVDVLPGPSAFVCAAVLSGFDLAGMSFDGFVPRKAGERERAFRAALASGRTSVWYESPNRIVATLETLAAVAPATRVFVGRELTKRHEQQIVGTPAAALAELARPVRGELVLALEGAADGGGRVRSQAFAGEAADADDAIDAHLASGDGVRATAQAIAAQFGLSRNVAYARVSRRAAERRDGGIAETRDASAAPGDGAANVGSSRV